MKNLIYVFLWMAVLFLAACSSAPAAPPPPVDVTIHATDIAYDVTTINTAAGQKVRLTFVNDGVLEHDFSIMKLPHSGEVTEMKMDDGHDDGHEHAMENMAEMPEIHTAASINGGTTVLEFTPSEAGEYEYFCTVPGHKEAGMVGKLIVGNP